MICFFMEMMINVKEIILINSKFGDGSNKRIPCNKFALFMLICYNVYVTIYSPKFNIYGGIIMGKKSKVFLILAIVFTMLFGIWGVVRIVKYVSFETNCTQYLKRAADANSVELAKAELKEAISYAESENLTTGRVSIFLNQPKNDIGYWYENLKTSYEELENLPSDTSSLEKTNVLMKLRETLTDTSEDGTEVTVPEGISIYPNNLAYCLWSIFSGILAIVSWFFFYVYIDE